MPRVIFAGSGQKGTVRTGSTVLDAALSLQAPMEHVCGGSASCTTCRFEVVHGLENLSLPTPAELALTLGPGLRLGCQTRILGDVTIRIVKFPGKTVFSKETHRE